MWLFYNLVIHFLFDEHLSCFQFCIIRHKAIMNILVQLFVDVIFLFLAITSELQQNTCSTIVLKSQLPTHCQCQCVSVLVDPNWFVCVCVCSVMSNSLQPHGLQPTRLFYPWDYPNKNTGMGCHFLLQGISLTHGSNQSLMSLLHWQVDSLPLNHLRSPHPSWYQYLI